LAASRGGDTERIAELWNVFGQPTHIATGDRDGLGRRRYDDRCAPASRPVAIVRNDTQLAEEVPGAQHRNGLATLPHLGSALFDRVEVEGEFALLDDDVPDVPLQPARHRGCACAILWREPREQRNALEIDVVYSI